MRQILAKWKHDYDLGYQVFSKILDWELADSDGDFDKDGLTNFEEIGVGTDPGYFDSDRDLLSDSWETTQGLNPLSAIGANGAAGDPDGDGVTNFNEAIYGSNPNSTDSDGDSTNDSAEISNGSDPADGSDNGQAPPAEEVYEVSFRVGDPSYSNSERWKMQIKGTNPAMHAQTFNFTSPYFGVMSERNFKLRRGATYEVSLTWVATDPYSEMEFPDYDWGATVGGKPTGYGEVAKLFVVEAKNDSSSTTWIVDNSEELLTPEFNGGV